MKSKVLCEYIETTFETLEILDDHELMVQIRQSMIEVEAGELICWEQSKVRLES